MRIMVFDVPAEEGGALTILKQYYNAALEDSKNEWFFVVSTPELSDSQNVKVLRFPWVKKSWLHRLYFDKFIARKLVSSFEINEVLSLQNIIIKGLNVRQTLYLHQPLPFVIKRYKATENFKFWLYQNVISRMIFNSIRRADKVIVQTNWMKEACLKKIIVKPSKIQVMPPNVEINIENKYTPDENQNNLFFYPASGFEYKNHGVIIKAAEKLFNDNITNFRIKLTLKGNETNYIRQFYDIVQEKKLPIEFIGQISLDQVYKYYTKSILIFPSYIETFGLPMLEAKLHKGIILASDYPFSHEILNGYNNAYFFDAFNADELYFLMKDIILGKIKYSFN